MGSLDQTARASAPSGSTSRNDKLRRERQARAAVNAAPTYAVVPQWWETAAYPSTFVVALGHTDAVGHFPIHYTSLLGLSKPWRAGRGAALYCIEGLYAYWGGVIELSTHLAHHVNVESLFRRGARHLDAWEVNGLLNETGAKLDVASRELKALLTRLPAPNPDIVMGERPTVQDPISKEWPPPSLQSLLHNRADYPLDWDSPNAVDIAVAIRELASVFDDFVDAEDSTGIHAAFVVRWKAPLERARSALDAAAERSGEMMDITHGSGWDAGGGSFDTSDTSDMSEGEGESSPSSTSDSDSDPDAAWGKEETAMETRERLGLAKWGEEAELIEQGDEYEDDQYTSAAGGA